MLACIIGYFITTCTCNLQNCLVQIFDLNQVDVSKNLLLSDMFLASMRNIFVHLDSRIGTYISMLYL